jgi:hypothetical protein
MQAADPPQTVLDAMDFEVATRVYAKLARTFKICLIGIRKMEGQVEPAGVLLCIHCVHAFRSFMISGSGLWSHRTATDRHPVYPEDVRSTHQSHRSVGFENQHPVCHAIHTPDIIMAASCVEQHQTKRKK